MANSIESVATPLSEFQACFGIPPGTQEAEAECKKWERLCAALIEERQRLREELLKAIADRNESLKSLYAMTYKEFNFTKEEIMSQIGKGPSLHEIIAELEQRLEKEA